MVDISATVTASTSCGGTPAVTLLALTSNEPDDAPGLGDGHTIGDIQDASFGNPDFNFKLRAERDGNGSGRIYKVTYQAQSGSGAKATATASVMVPKSGAKEKRGISDTGDRDGGKKNGPKGGSPGDSDAP
jgi:large repetitive protein